MRMLSDETGSGHVASDGTIGRRRILAGDCRVEIVGASGLAVAGWPSNRSTATTGYVFQSREFLELWNETIAPVRRATLQGVIVRTDEGAPVMYLPLAVERPGGLSILRFVDGGVSDMNAPVLAGDVELAQGEMPALWRKILEALPRIDAAAFGKIAGHVKDRPNPLTELTVTPFGSTGNLIDITGTYADYLALPVRQSEAGKIESRRRKIARMGEVVFEIAETPAEAQAMFEALVDYKRRQFLRTYGFDNFEESGLLAFYRAALAEGRLGSLTEIAAERCGDTITAALLGFVEPDRFSFVLTAYEPERFNRFSAGARVLLTLIRRSFDLKHSTFDLGEGNLPYKDIWATRRLPLHDYRATLTWRGSAFFAVKRALDAQRRWRDWLRAALTARKA